MNWLRVGDEVRVICPSSQWRDACGVITQVIQRGDERAPGKLQECVVTFKTERRWFMAEHLTRIRSPKLDRFLRSELSNRWPIEPVLAESINVSRDSLIGFLSDHFGFSKTRATIEVDEFFRVFREKLQRARDAENPVQLMPPERHQTAVAIPLTLTRLQLQ